MAASLTLSQGGVFGGMFLGEFLPNPPFTVIPRVAYEQVHKYLVAAGHVDSGGVGKCVDRAVKHFSDGDIQQLAYCVKEVGSSSSGT